MITTKRADLLSADRLLVFSAIIFPLDGDGFFRYNPQVEREIGLAALWEDFVFGLFFFGYTKGVLYFYRACLAYDPFRLWSILEAKNGGKVMQEIEVTNELGLRVFINGVPDLRQIPKDIAESIIAALELQISDYYKSEQKADG